MDRFYRFINLGILYSNDDWTVWKIFNGCWAVTNIKFSDTDSSNFCPLPMRILSDVNKTYIDISNGKIKVWAIKMWIFG